MPMPNCIMFVLNGNFKADAEKVIAKSQELGKGVMVRYRYADEHNRLYENEGVPDSALSDPTALDITLSAMEQYSGYTKEERYSFLVLTK